MIYAAFGLHSWIKIKYLQGSKSVRFDVARAIQDLTKKITHRHGSSLQFVLLFFRFQLYEIRESGNLLGV